MLKLSLIPLCSLWCALLAGWPSAAHGQMRATTGDLTGVVYDPSKAILRGVTVIVTNSDTGLARTQTTDGHGHFAFPALPPGTYRLRAELTLFAPQVRDGLVLEVGSAVDLELTMSLAGAAEQLTVTAQSPIVDTQRSAVATVVSQQQIESLPINGRNFISFSVITPGVTHRPHAAAGRVRHVRPLVRGSAGALEQHHGRRRRQQRSRRRLRARRRSARKRSGSSRCSRIPTPRSSARPRAASSTSSPRAARTSCAATSSMFFRDESLNAKDHFEQFDPAGHALDRAKAPFRQKQFGATFGGPIRRDQDASSSLSFERLDIDANNFVNIDDRTVSRSERRRYAETDPRARRLPGGNRQRAVSRGERCSCWRSSIISVPAPRTSARGSTTATR